MQLNFGCRGGRFLVTKIAKTCREGIKYWKSEKQNLLGGVLLAKVQGERTLSFLFYKRNKNFSKHRTRALASRIELIAETGPI